MACCDKRKSHKHTKVPAQPVDGDVLLQKHLKICKECDQCKRVGFVLFCEAGFGDLNVRGRLRIPCPHLEGDKWKEIQ